MAFRNLFRHHSREGAEPHWRPSGLHPAEGSWWPPLSPEHLWLPSPSTRSVSTFPVASLRVGGRLIPKAHFSLLCKSQCSRDTIVHFPSSSLPPWKLSTSSGKESLPLSPFPDPTIRGSQLCSPFSKMWWLVVVGGGEQPCLFRREGQAIPSCCRTTEALVFMDY